MKTSIISILIIAGGILAQQPPTPEIICSKGCRYCEKPKTLKEIDGGLTQGPVPVDGHCSKGCGNALFNPKTGKCVESSVVDTSSTRCLLFSSENTCEQCQIGYAIVDNVCVPHTIEKCVIAFGPSVQELYCEVCQDGYPSKDMKTCGGWTQELQQQQVNPCDQGGRMQLNPDTQFCYKCKTGYVGKDLVCIKNDAQLNGCLTTEETDATKCEVCDTSAGFYMKNPGKCANLNE